MIYFNIINALLTLYLIKENKRLKRYEKNYKAGINKAVDYVNYMNKNNLL